MSKTKKEDKKVRRREGKKIRISSLLGSFSSPPLLFLTFYVLSTAPLSGDSPQQASNRVFLFLFSIVIIPFLLVLCILL
jgi:hypothetical protein